MSKKHSPPTKKQKTAAGVTGATPTPTNIFVSPMLTDMYQISMTYAYWKAGKVDEHAVFDLFFRKAPFSGEFAIFAGLDEVLPLLENFKFTASDIDYLRTILPGADSAFFTWLLTLGNKIQPLCSTFSFHIISFRLGLSLSMSFFCFHSISFLSSSLSSFAFIFIYL